MIWWIADNYDYVILVAGIVALCFAAAWWGNRNNKLLLGVAIPILLAIVAWLLSIVIDTDRMQLRRNVNAMCELLNAGKLEQIIQQHFDDEVKIDAADGDKTVKKADLFAIAKSHIGRFGVKSAFVNKIDVEELARQRATVSFIVGLEDSPERALCTMGFVLSPDGKWRVRTITVETVIGKQKLLRVN